MEQVKKSDTWLRARTGRVRASLLLLWAEAWEQTPCGSLPNDDELLCLLLDVEPDEFAKMRPVLMRGWWLGDDGRLYHDTITDRVLDMLKARAGNAKRVAEHKAKKRDERVGNALPTGQQQGCQHGSNDTGTGRQIRDTENYPDAGGCANALEDGEFDPGEFVGHIQPTQAGALCRDLRLAGIADVNPGHPRLLALLAAGAQPAEFTGFVPVALDKNPRTPFTYLLGMVEGERTRAAAMAGQLHRGAMPAAPMTAKAAENAKWVKGTSLDRSTHQDTIHAATVAIR